MVFDSENFMRIAFEYRGAEHVEETCIGQFYAIYIKYTFIFKFNRIVTIEICCACGYFDSRGIEL